MKQNAGLWIDHKKAVVVFLIGEEEKTIIIHSKIEDHHLSSGMATADDIRQRELTAHLNIYYDEVVSSLQNAEAVLLFGPGEAKGEFKKRLERVHLGDHIVGIETADKMTDPQIVARVKNHFLHLNGSK
jgi:stalled ribosome rescue protein Dom34